MYVFGKRIKQFRCLHMPLFAIKASLDWGGACRILFILLRRKSKCLSYDTFREKEELIFVEDFFWKKTIGVKYWFVFVPGTTYL